MRDTISHMPIIRSAKKALRQNIRRRKRNLGKKEVAKRAVRDYKKFVATKDPERATSELAKVYKLLDKMAKGGVIKKNKASRLKSRLTHLIAKATRTSS